MLEIIWMQIIVFMIWIVSFFCRLPVEQCIKHRGTLVIACLLFVANYLRRRQRQFFHVITSFVSCFYPKTLLHKMLYINCRPRKLYLFAFLFFSNSILIFEFVYNFTSSALSISFLFFFSSQFAEQRYGKCFATQRNGFQTW